MANQADVFIHNNAGYGIQVTRKIIDGPIDLEEVLDSGIRKKINMPGPEVELIIQTPDNIDTKYYPVKVKSDVDLLVSHSRSHSRWTFKIEPNELPPDTPADVNVTIDDDEPE